MPAPQLTPLDRVQGVAVKGMLALPPRVQRLLSGGKPVRIDGLELDPQMQLLTTVMNLDGFQLRDPDPAVARERFSRDSASLSGSTIELAWTRDLEVAGAEGGLPARLYVPHGYRAPGALLVYFHGGAWVIGDVDSHDTTCRFLARHSGVALISVAYRLAPEHPYPAPVDDVVAAFADIAARADELGADALRIGVGGDSAGGHLAAVTSIQAVRDGSVAPAFQLLIYPAVDHVGTWPSVDLFAEGLLLERADMEWGRSHLLPDGIDRSDERVSPLHAGDLSGVAPAYVVTGGFDPLRDEGEAYAARLREAGVLTTLRRQRSLVHGFVQLVSISSAAARATAEVAGALQVGLSPGAA